MPGGPPDEETPEPSEAGPGALPELSGAAIAGRAVLAGALAAATSTVFTLVLFWALASLAGELKTRVQLLGLGVLAIGAGLFAGGATAAFRACELGLERLRRGVIRDGLAALAGILAGALGLACAALPGTYAIGLLRHRSLAGGLTQLERLGTAIENDQKARTFVVLLVLVTFPLPFVAVARARGWRRGVQACFPVLAFMFVSVVYRVLVCPALLPWLPGSEKLADEINGLICLVAGVTPLLPFALAAVESGEKRVSAALARRAAARAS